MRVPIALGVVVVFGSMLLIDPSALVHVTVFCVTGGCGVRPMWIAGGAVAVALAVLLSFGRSRTHVRVARKGLPRLKRKQAGAGRKSKRVKSHRTAASRRKPLAD